MATRDRGAMGAGLGAAGEGLGAAGGSMCHGLAGSQRPPRRWRAGALQTHGPGAALAEGKHPPLWGWKRRGEVARGV